MAATMTRADHVVDLRALTTAFAPPPAYFEDLWLAAPERIEQLQLRRLQVELERAARIPFYARHWSAAGFDHRAVRSLSDLTAAPRYTSDHLRASIDAYPPYGDHQAFVMERARHGEPVSIFFSDGTTGVPRPSVNLQWDLEVLGILTARTFWLAGLRPGDVILNAWAYGTHAAAPFMDRGIRWLGATPITVSSGSVTPSTRQVEFARWYGAASIAAIGNHLVHLGDVAKEMGFDPSTDFALRSFPGPAAGQSQKVEHVWGVPSYESYGFNECAYVGVECPARGGLHVFEDAYVVEVVDVDTGNPVPDGELGNLVVTSLFRTGTAQVRYDVKDLSRLFPRHQCDCGSWMRKIDYYGGRSDSMVKLRGTNVWPDGVGTVAIGRPRCTGEYFVDFFTDGTRDEMRIRLEVVAEPEEWPALTDELERHIRDQLGIRIGVELCGRGGLVALAGDGAKRRRFQDVRS